MVDTHNRAYRTLDHYQLIHFLGEGTYGEAWFAIDTKQQRTVAVKIFKDMGG